MDLVLLAPTKKGHGMDHWLDGRMECRNDLRTYLLVENVKTDNSACFWDQNCGQTQTIES